MSQLNNTTASLGIPSPLEKQYIDPHDVNDFTSQLLIFAWVSATLIVAGFMSLLHWLNTPMPQRTIGQAILAYMNGLAVALLTSLFIGDKVLSHEMSILQFTFCVLVASIGGAQMLGLAVKLAGRAASAIFQIQVKK